MVPSAQKRITGFSGPFSEKKKAFLFAPQPKRRLFWTGNGLGWILPAILLAGWEILARVSLIDISLFSSPSQIGAELWKITSNGELLSHLEATSLRVFSGFAIGISAATVLGAFTGYSSIARRLLDPLLQSLRSIPSMALGAAIPLVAWDRRELQNLPDCLGRLFPRLSEPDERRAERGS